MFELFAVGTFWFWALIVSEFILLLFFVNSENGFSAFISLLVFAACLQFLGDADILKMVVENPLWTVVIAVAYVFISVPWGIFRWSMYCRDMLEIYEDDKADFLRQSGYPKAKVVPSELRAEWKNHVQNTKDHITNRTIADPPLAKENKKFITRVMSLWVIDVIWFVLGDMCVRVWKIVHRRISGLLQHISDNMFSKSNIKDDLDVDVDPD